MSNMVYFAPIQTVQSVQPVPPRLKTKKQMFIENELRNFNIVLKKYKEMRSLKQSRRNKFRKYWIYMKLSQGELITNNDQNVWKQLRARLKHCSCCELSAQLNETRKFLKLRENGCVRVLNFYPGARKLKF